MNKILIAVVVVLFLGVGGYFYMNSKGMTPKIPVGNSGGNVFSSIKDALSKSLSLKCVYKDEKGVATTTYIKAGSVRVMMAANQDGEQPDNLVLKDQKMYMWSDATKAGFVYNLEQPETSPGPTSEATNNGSQEASMLAQIEKYKDACKPEVIADSYFTIPTDVKFQDMSALQEQMMNAAPQGDTNSTDYQDYVNQMMQQQGAQ